MKQSTETTFKKKPSFLKRFFKLCAYALGTLTILTGLLLTWIALNPIDLDSYKSEIESGIDLSEEGLSLTFGHAQIGWGKWTNPIEIQLTDVALKELSGQPLVDVPKMGISLKFKPLISGNIQPKSIRLYHPRISLKRLANRSIQFLTPQDAETTDTQTSFEDIEPYLTTSASPVSLPRSIKVFGATIALHDESSSEVIEWNNIDFYLKRYADKFSCGLTLHANGQKARGLIKFDASYEVGTDLLYLTAHFKHLVPANFFSNKSIDTVLSWVNAPTLQNIIHSFHRIDAPINGMIGGRFKTSTLDLISGESHLSLERGQLHLGEVGIKLPEEGLQIEKITNKILLTPQHIYLDQKIILPAGTIVTSKGGIDSTTPFTLEDLLPQGSAIKLDTHVNGIKIQDLPFLWPEDMAPGARQWVTQHITNGHIDHTSFQFGGVQKDTFDVQKLSGDLHLSKGHIDYFGDLPPIKELKARAHFSAQDITIEIERGTLNQLPLQHSTVVVGGLDQEKQFVDVNLKTNGQLQHMLEVLNAQPLTLMDSANIKTDTSSGDFSTSLTLHIPLIKDLKFSAVGIEAEGKFNKTGLDIHQGDKPITLSKADGTFKIKDRTLTIDGSGVADKMPVRLKLIQYFEQPKSSPWSLKVTASTDLPVNDFKKYGVDAGSYAKGDTVTSVSYLQSSRDKTSDLALDIDMKKAEVNLPEIGWSKAPGSPLKVSFILKREKGKIKALQDLKVTSDFLNTSGYVSFDENENWRQVAARSLTYPGTNTAASIIRQGDNGFDIYVSGQSLNVEAFMSFLQQPSKAKKRIDVIPVNLTGSVNTLTLGPERTFRNVDTEVSLDVLPDGTLWDFIHLRAEAGQGTANKGDMSQIEGGISMDLSRPQNGVQILEIRANDAGQALKNIEIYDALSGGAMTLKAQRTANGKERGPYKGTFKLKDFGAEKVPFLARLGSVLSPMGIANLFSSNQQVSFRRFTCDFSYGPDLFEIQNGSGRSISIGFTVEGTLDRQTKIFDMKGKIIPAYAINSILNDIPIVGEIFGGKNEGLIAMKYTMKGPTDNPDVSVDPLTALAPGFIRNLFGD